MSKSSARYATAGRAVGYIGEENNTALPRVDQELIEQLSDTACDLSYPVPATKPQLTTPRQKGPQLFTTSLLALSRGHSELGWRAHGWRHLLGDVLELAQKLVVIPLKIWVG